MSGSSRKGERSKNDTWGEKELSKYIGGSQGKAREKDSSSKKKVTIDLYGSHGSPKSETKRKAGSSSSSGNSKPSAGSSQKTSTSIASSSGKGRSTTVEDKSRERLSEKARTSRDSADKRDSGRERSKDMTAKRSSKDSKESRDNQDSKSSSSKGRDRDVHGRRDLNSKLGRSQPRESRGGSEGRSHHQSSERNKERRKEDGKESKTSRDKRMGDHHKEQARRREMDKARDRTSGSHDKEGKGSKRAGKIVVQEDPPAPVPEEEDNIEVSAVGESGWSMEGNLPQQMVEVNEEEYQYEDEEFEDYEYEEDFDEVPEEEEQTASRSESEDEERLATPTEGRGSQATVKSRVHHQQDNQQRPVDLFAIMQAIDAENMAMESSSQSNIIEPSFDNVDGTVIVKFTPKDSDGEGEGVQEEAEIERKHESLKSPSRKFVDFSHAQRNEASLKVAKKTRKRAQELLSMIELDIVSHDMFDLPPLSEYELYVKKFGADDTRQVSIQSGEDNQDSEVQTETITTEERWVQWPPEDLRGWGKGGNPDDCEEGDAAALSGLGKMEGEGALRLISFLKKASQVCSVLLEENLAAVGQSTFQSTQSPFPFCSSTQRIQAIPLFLSGRWVRWIDFSSTQDHLFLAAYTLPPPSSKSVDSGIRGKGLVCLWNTRDPLQPQMVLSCESCPTCCCFSPHKTSLAFAGNEDGSVVLWDLREPLSMHKDQSTATPLSPRGKGAEYIARVPTFSTAGVPHLDNHRAPIVSITPISTSSASSDGNHGDDGDIQKTSGGLSFQLATLDKTGHLNIWVVVEVVNPDPYGSEADLGLVPGGRVKLVKSTSINVASQPASRATERSLQSHSSIQVFCMEFHPQDTSCLYVGADTGRVCHVTRYGRRPIPRYHIPVLDNEAAVCDVLSVSFSRRQPDHFLAGCSDGSLKLYHTKRAKPLLSWNTFASYGASVVHVQWVESCPGLLLLQDSFNTIYMWDLLQNDSEPVYKEIQKSRITCCQLHSQSLTHKSSAPPTLILAHEDSSIAVHKFKELFQDISEREQVFDDYLANLA